ncbi:MAG TPA: hypothetical protein VNT26_10955, partial [Candidatus Sulfotelmatobacter sp.]|nr:hypothetical protein [Candidatus Sulfotelmatobacter sp.]
MSSSRFAHNALVCWALAIASPVVGWAQSSYLPQASEYAVAGSMPGDQVRPQLSVGTTGGFLVWEDNITDGYGLGVSALRLDSSFSSVLSPFRVNLTAAGDQSRPQVSLLKDDGAAFVWQGGPQSFQHIYARFLSRSNIWVTDDVQVNTATKAYQIDPVVATLANSNI